MYFESDECLVIAITHHPVPSSGKNAGDVVQIGVGVRLDHVEAFFGRIVRFIGRGKGHQFIDALRGILTRLRDNPKDFGERLYRLPALKLVIAVIAPIAVDYGVHEEKALVFIRGINVLGEA